jgi:murein DD-endopeptidase MepM/ murein hydrolase activator NlpD
MSSPRRTKHLVSIDHWDASFLAAVAAVKAKKGVTVDPRVMKAMMAVESGNDGNYPPDRCRSDGSCGPMQVKFPIHSWRCPDCNTKTVPGQIELATHIIGDTMKANGVDEYGAITSVYFPTDDILNGTTQQAYIAKVRSLVATMSGITPVPPPPPPPPALTKQALLDLLSSNTPGVYISFGFNQPNQNADGSYNNFYAYGKGHGTSGNMMHTGNDVWMPRGTNVRSLTGGRVVCVGGQGEVTWGQGCGSFEDDRHGTGNITILTDAVMTINGKPYQLKITYGHMSQSNVVYGQQVTHGQVIGKSGTGNGFDHVHLDVSINAPELNNPSAWNNPGEYHLEDPFPALLNALSGVPLPVTYADRIPVPQPSEFDVSAKVVTTKDGVPVLQRASFDASAVRAPLSKGEDFQAVYQVIGNDKRIYWITTLGSRVPVEGTESDEWSA